MLEILDGDGSVGARSPAPDVDLVAHVGITATGRAIALAGARTGAKAVLENGGNDPLIVDADVDPAWAAEQAALGAFANAGQICVSVERIYCHAASPTRSSPRWPRRPRPGRSGSARSSTAGSATTCTGRSPRRSPPARAC